MFYCPIMLVELESNKAPFSDHYLDCEGPTQINNEGMKALRAAGCCMHIPDTVAGESGQGAELVLDQFLSWLWSMYITASMVMFVEVS